MASVPARPLGATSLAVRRFSLAEGLAGTHVNHVVRDSRGFLWFATSDGLSRFDGASFRNYGTGDGLPASDVLHVLEDDEGTLWFATAGGLARMRRDAPPGRPISRVGEERLVPILARGTGGIWAVDATANALRLFDRGGRELRALPLDPAWGDVAAIAEIPEGLVLGTGIGLRLVLPNGSSRPRSVRPHRGGDEVHALAVDPAGRLVVAHGFGLFVAAGPGRLFWAGPDLPLASVARPLVEGGLLKLPGGDGEVRLLALAASPDSPSFVETATVLADGRVLAASRTAIVLLERGGARVLELSTELRGASLSAIAEDTSGNLWLGTTVDGALRVLRSGFVTFGREDGLPGTPLTSVFRDRAGALYVTAGLSVSRLEGDRFRTALPALPPSVKEVGWGSRQVALFDRQGAYWFASGDGLLLFDGPFEGLDGRRPRRVFSEADGLCGREVFRLFEDRRGDIWASTFGPCFLNRWERGTGRIYRYTPENGTPPSTMTAFAEDGEGTLWLGSYGDGVFVLDGDRLVRPGSGAPLDTTVTTIAIGSGGKVLVATSSRGLFVATGGRGARRWRRLTVGEGLSSDKVLTAVEGRDGLLYVATSKGVDRVDLVSGIVRPMSYEAGVPGEVVASIEDGNGCLLFATRFGLGRYCAGSEGAPPPAPVLISQVHVGNRSVPVSPFGTGTLDAGSAGPGPLPVEVEFFGIGFVPGESLMYRYRVPELDPSWSPPRPDRLVRLAALPAGRFHLEVEAVRSGRPAGRAATLVFEIVPPFYRRPVFWVLGAALAAAIAIGLERARVRQLVALERVRTRIATDLHDDLGSSLSRISILSEVALRRLEGDADAAGRLLGEIGTTARELAEALSDSIWSVDPRRDDLRSLLDRVKRFSGDFLEAHGITWKLEGPPETALVALSPLERRHLFLLVKEALHNVVKHSGARHVGVLAAIRDRELQLTVSDDGRGLAAASPSPEGRGLPGMRARAAELGGTVAFEVPETGGTRLVVTIPLSMA